MTAVSLSMSRGKTGNIASDITVGSSAPGTGDFEFRYNQTSNGNITRKELKLALKAFERAIQQGGGVVITTGVVGPPG